jgi:hypothetical protein
MTESPASRLLARPADEASSPLAHPLKFEVKKNGPKEKQKGLLNPGLYSAPSPWDRPLPSLSFLAF